RYTPMNNASLRPFQRVAGALRGGFLALCGLLLVGWPAMHASAAEPMKIGIIGAGNMGGTLAELWAKAGHEVMISSRHPDEIEAQAQAIGPNAHAGTAREAAAFGSVVVIA